MTAAPLQQRFEKVAMETLRGGLAVVTGASSGIGRAIALALAAERADVCLVARRRDELEETARRVCTGGGRGYVCPADLTREEEIRAVAETVDRDFGRADVLVLCGGAMFHGTTEQASLEQFDIMYRANIRGHYTLVQSLLPLLRKQRGQIVFINSSTGLRSPASMGQFSATQHAFRALANSLREEVNADGIRVLSVYPGRTATPRMEVMYAREGIPYRPELLLQPEDIAVMVTQALRLPRTAEVTDINIRPMQKSY